MLKSIFLLLMLTCGNVFANIGVELDVVFKADSSTFKYRYLYVLCPAADGTSDTLAVFDSLYFNGKNRVSLFYFMPSGGKNMLSIVDSTGVFVESKPFRVSPHRTTFAVFVGQEQIDVLTRDYLYLRKNENEYSYYVFLLIFFVVKFLITVIFVFFSKLPKRTVSIASGAFILSAFIDWLFPLNYLYRFLMITLTEYLLIALVGRKSISWLRTAMLILVVNFSGFGIIAMAYLLYVFW